MVAKMSSESENDRFDRAILEILAKDGRITITDLAQRVGLSKTPTQVRLRRLIENGTIMGFRAVIGPTRLGLDHVAFTEVKLSDTRETALREFRSEEHTSELQSLMRNSYAVFCLKKKK